MYVVLQIWWAAERSGWLCTLFGRYGEQLNGRYDCVCCFAAMVSSWTVGMTVYVVLQVWWAAELSVWLCMLFCRYGEQLNCRYDCVCCFAGMVSSWTVGMTLERNTNPVRSEPLQPAGSTTPAAALVASPGGRKKDEPMNSRNSPATLNVLTSSAEFKEDFFNRY